MEKKLTKKELQDYKKYSMALQEKMAKELGFVLWELNGKKFFATKNYGKQEKNAKLVKQQ